VKWRSDDGQFDISGYWPSREAKLDVKDVTRGRTNDRMFLFVNGRPAVDASIERSITQCFRTHTTAKSTLLSLDIDLHLINIMMLC
jgi:DNA mismatch repair ATPase MutL